MSAGTFDGLAAVVTGGASGIGLATVNMLHSLGARVASLDVRHNSGKRAQDGVLLVDADVRSATSVSSAIDRAVSEFGKLDVVVNNAGIGAAGTVEDNSEDEWKAVFDVNVLGMMRVLRASLPHLRKSPHAAVVNVASIAATAGLPRRALYSATKGAVVSLTLAMAADHLEDNVRVNCVAPGTADTPWVQRLLDAADDPAAERRALELRQPMGRLITAREVAAAIVYLASPQASSTTGTILAVDGGMQGLRLRK